MPYHPTAPPATAAAMTPTPATGPAAATQTPTPLTAAANAALGTEAMHALESQTTYDAGHVHEYDVDFNGNGIAKEICHPESNHICHSHAITNHQVAEAQSSCYPNCKSLYGFDGAPPHIHGLDSFVPTIGPEVLQTDEPGHVTTLNISVDDLLLENNSIQVGGLVDGMSDGYIRIVATNNREVHDGLSVFTADAENSIPFIKTILFPDSGMSFFKKSEKDFSDVGKLHIKDSKITNFLFDIKIDNFLVEDFLSLIMIVHLDGTGHTIFEEIPIFGELHTRNYITDLRKNQKTSAKLQVKTNQGKKEKIEKKEKSVVGNLEAELGDTISAVKKKKELYWSKFYHTFDDGGNLRYVFSFDFDSFCEKNALFPSLVDGASMDNIVDIIFRRRRLEYPATEKHIEYSNSPTIAVENISLSNSFGIMTLAGTDQEINPASTYKYKITILMTDRTIQVAQQIADRLIQLKEALQEGSRSEIISEVYTIILNLYYNIIPDEYIMIKKMYNNPKDNDAYDNKVLKLVEETMQSLIINVKNKLDSVKKTGKTKTKATPSTGPNYMTSTAVDPTADLTHLSESTGALPKRIFDIEHEFPDIIKFSEMPKINLNFSNNNSLNVITKDDFFKILESGLASATQDKVQAFITYKKPKPTVEFSSEIKISKRTKTENKKELTLMWSKAISQKDLNTQMSDSPALFTHTSSPTLSEIEFEYASSYKNDSIIGDNGVTLLKWLQLKKENIENLGTHGKLFVRIAGPEKIINKYFFVVGE